MMTRMRIRRMSHTLKLGELRRYPPVTRCSCQMVAASYQAGPGSCQLAGGSGQVAFATVSAARLASCQPPAASLPADHRNPKFCPAWWILSQGHQKIKLLTSWVCFLCACLLC